MVRVGCARDVHRGRVLGSSMKSMGVRGAHRGIAPFLEVQQATLAGCDAESIRYAGG